MKIKKFVLLFILIIISLCFVSCGKVDFDNLKIIAKSVTDVEQGEYTLEYTIDNLEKFSEKYDLIVSVKVFDDSNRAIEVENNRTFEAQSDNVYYVTVYVSATVNGKIQTKSKSFTITTVKTDPKLVLKLHIQGNDYDYRVIDLTYGQDFYIDALPDIPKISPTEDGYDLVVTDSYWTIRDILGESEKLSQEHLNNIVKTTTIYAYYEIKKLPKECTITFETNGGGEISPITQTFGSTVTRPIDPVKEGYHFLGWYNDADFNDLYSWTNASPMPSSRTLYAKWLKDNGSNLEHFDFIYTADYNTGYGYYAAKVKDGVQLSGDVVIPNGYENKPVKIIEELAFANQDQIETIIVPDTIIAIRPSAFSNCTSLTSIDLTKTNIDRFNSKIFENCESLQTLAVPDSVINIVNDAFSGCSSLSELIFTKESQLKTLYKEAFKDTKVNRLTLPYLMKNRFEGGQNIQVDFFEAITED
ncbi:MAG: leucine-rich repeat protein [Clostridiales bacterium]|nr:leucine-rich repeat protein [Clostridiales bacterium]